MIKLRNGTDKLKNKNCNTCKYKDLEHPNEKWFEKCFICILANKWKPINK